MPDVESQGAAAGGKTLDIIISAGLLVLGIALLASTFGQSFQVRTFGGDVGPAFAPRLFLGAWVLFAALALVQAFASGSDPLGAIRLRQLALVLIIASLTALAMMTFGFVFAMVPGMSAFILAFGYRRPLPILVAGVVTPVLVWALFTFVFELFLPRSPWFHMI